MLKNYFTSAKRNISILLAAALAFSSLFIGSISAVSDENGYVGTEEAGYTGEGNIYDTPTPNAEFKNFDFEQGFKYWQIPENAKDYTEIVTEESGNKALHLMCTAENKEMLGAYVYSYPITLKNIGVGTEFALCADVKVANFSEGNDNTRITFNLTSSDATLNSNNSMRWAIKADTDGYVKNSVRGKITELPEGKDEVTLYLVISRYNFVADIYIDNIEIGYQTDATYQFESNKRMVHYLPLTEGGDTLVAKTQNVFELYRLSEKGYYGGTNTSKFLIRSNELVNGDFSQGLTGWSPYNSYNNANVFTSDAVTVDDFDGDGDKEACLIYESGARPGMISTAFPLSGAKAGDRFSLYFEYKWDTSEGANVNLGCIYAQLLGVTNGDIKYSSDPYIGVTYGGTSNYDKGIKTDLGNGWYSATVGCTGYINVDEPEVYVQIFQNWGGNKTKIYIDNIKVMTAKNVSANSTNEFAYEFFGSDNDGKYYDTDGVTELQPYGTVADGIETKGNYQTSSFGKKLINSDNIFDFGKYGLKYWSAAVQDNGNFGNTKASDSAKVNADGSVTLRYKDKSAQGISSVYFPLPEAVTKNGTNYAVWLRYSRTATEATDATQSFLRVDSGTTAGSTYSSDGESKGIATFNAQAKQFGDTYYGTVNLKVTGTQFNFDISDITIGYVDKGGMEKPLYVYQDGTPRDSVVGDVNADKAVNILDLVRMKKRIADNSTAIYFAAADFDGSNEINAYDLSALKLKLLKN